MRIISADAISVNGKITLGIDANAYTWTSAEDKAHFRALIDAHDVLVMGSTTYKAVHPQTEPGRLKIVLTRHPERYQDKSVQDQLEFISALPHELVEQLQARGFKKILLVGGQVNTQFWAAGLVDEAYITVEPFMSGTGKTLLDGADFTASLRLLSIERLNAQGTLLAHYAVEK